MGIRPKFTEGSVRAEIEKQWGRVENHMLQIMAYVGEKFVTSARTAMNIDSSAYPKGDYTDQTDNLRGSIGYAILKDGNVVKSNYKGTAEGETAARSILGEIPKKRRGYQLIGMAGMEYASYLEAMGYNVISSQSEVALADLSKMLTKYAARKGFGLSIDATGVVLGMR